MSADLIAQLLRVDAVAKRAKDDSRVFIDTKDWEALLAQARAEPEAEPSLGLRLCLDSEWNLLIHAPRQPGQAHGATFSIGALGRSPERDARAMAAILRMLQEQALAQGAKVPADRRSAITVGTLASPALSEVEQWMRQNHVTISASRTASPKTAEEHGL